MENRLTRQTDASVAASRSRDARGGAFNRALNRPSSTLIGSDRRVASLRGRPGGPHVSLRDPLHHWEIKLELRASSTDLANVMGTARSTATNAALK